MQRAGAGFGALGVPAQQAGFRVNEDPGSREPGRDGSSFIGRPVAAIISACMARPRCRLKFPRLKAGCVSLSRPTSSFHFEL